MSILKVEITLLSLLAFSLWYLNSSFFPNTFWTKIPKYFAILWLYLFKKFYYMKVLKYIYKGFGSVVYSDYV